jgi:MFS transporter, DHA3 family, macrolide efflux protein
MIVGTHIISRIAKKRSKEHLMMAGLFLVAAGILLLAVFGNVPLTVAVTLILGFGVAMVIIPAQTLMQGQTPMEMLGRVTSSLMSVLSFAQVCGLVLSGSIAQAIGIRNSYFATSALLALISSAGWMMVERRKTAAAAA